jgi:hypothetical protein
VRGPAGAPSTTGAAGGNRHPAQTAANVTHAHAPILRNPAFAGLSSRNPSTRSLAESTFRGRFAQSGFAQAWNRHHHHRSGIVLGFIGSLFWPYAYEDFVDYTFGPYAYDTFWPYAYDDVFEGIYGGYAPEYYAAEDAYAYAGAPASGAEYSYATGRTRRARATAPSGGGSQICSGQAQGLTDFPIERIARQVEPDQDQQALLDDVKAATANAVHSLQAACPNDLPSTPTERLAAMRTRIEAMLQAVQVVRPILDTFYESLSDEQKARFDALDQDNEPSASQQPSLASLCNGRAAQAAGLPIDRIERTLGLSARQDALLKDLSDATAKAQGTLKANCQPDQKMSPTGRLAAMEDRLSTMLQALDTVQPALANFYGSLTDEQKAHFNRLSARRA